MSTRPATLDLIQSESDLPEHLVPVCLGGDILGYTYVRSFELLYGIRTTILSGIDVKMTSSSRFCDYRIVDGMDDPDTLMDYLRKLGAELAGDQKVGLLLGSADWHIRFLSQHKEELSEWFVVPYLDFDLLDDITQKERFYQICEELGIAYPKSVMLDCADADGVADARDLTYPLIAKPSNSASYDLMEFEGREKIYTVTTPDDLARVYGLLRDNGYRHGLVVQDLIPGDDDAIRTLTTFSDASGALKVVSGGQVVLQDHAPQALGNPVTILSERVPEVIEAARRFLAHTGYHGFANFDLKYDDRDGTYKFFEVNARPGRNSYYMTLGGVDFARLFVEDYVLGHEVDEAEAYDPFVYTVVPARVVRDHVGDAGLREKVLGLFRDGKAASPLECPGESAAHRMWVALRDQRQVSKFNTYMPKA